MELKNDEDLIFVLDIGTRSVIGLVGYYQNALFKVLASDMVMHPKRAMIDGQIEDIAQVATIAGQVKTNLETKLGISLTRVSVAAAGRALKTCTAKHSVTIGGGIVSEQTVYELENGAINAARNQLNQESDTLQYYCVGYSVVRYSLDDYPFLTILDHRGTAAEVEIIATFLPTEVVFSLRRCMEMLHLEIDTLTLEPIAAIRAVIPSDVRLLNLALVDIGAGTSDIALSRDGAVSGYTMATVAGDEITEALIKKYLVNFETAESMKVSLGNAESIVYHDILGFEYTVPTREVLQAIEPAVEMLAQIISDRIISVNDGFPNAVFLVGGGSKIPTIASKIAQRLELDANKVALAGKSFSGRILNENSGADGPEFATPVGIALTAADNASKESTCVTINGQKIRLYTPEVSRVMDVLLIAGFRYGDLMGRSGESLTFTLNGVRKVVRGGHYTSATITVNGKTASLVTPVENDSIIDIVPAVAGKDATATIADFTDGIQPFTVSVNGQSLAAGAVAKCNGATVTMETSIRNLDDVEIYLVQTLADLALANGLAIENTSFYCGDTRLEPDTLLQPDSNLVTQKKPLQMQTVHSNFPLSKDAVPNLSESSALPTVFSKEIEQTTDDTNLQPAHLPVKILSVEKSNFDSSPPNIDKVSPEKDIMDEKKSDFSPISGGSLRVSLNGKTVVLPPKANFEPHYLFDLMPLIDIDPAKPQGLIQVTINNKKASYLDTVTNNDTVIIGWENE